MTRRNGKVAIIGNCPATSCVILARALGSISLYLQIVGRALRVAPGKDDAVIIDLHGSSHAFGEPDEEREFDLDGEGIKRKGEVVDVRHCIGCGVTMDGDATVCDLCGIARPELLAPDVVNAKLVKFAAKRRETDEKKAQTLHRWISEAVAKTHKPGAAFYKYGAVYGERPTARVMEIQRKLAGKPQ